MSVECLCNHNACRTVADQRQDLVYPEYHQVLRAFGLVLLGRKVSARHAGDEIRIVVFADLRQKESYALITCPVLDEHAGSMRVFDYVTISQTLAHNKADHAVFQNARGRVYRSGDFSARIGR